MAIMYMVNRTIGKEGKYVDHPSDPGGETKWGITKNVAVNAGYKGSMKDLPRETVVGIYVKTYADKPGFTEIAKINERIAEKLFDMGVNLGVSWPGIWLQTALNAFNSQAKHYADIGVDGICGTGTRNALKAYLAKRGELGVDVMLKALNVQQGARYLDISKKNGKLEDFTFGWFANRVD